MSCKPSLFYLLVVLFSSMFLISCRSLKPISGKNILETLTIDDVKKLDGYYGFVSTDSIYRTLENVFFNQHLLEKDSDRINLHAIDGRHLKVSALRNNKVIRTTILKGKISHNYFVFSQLHFGPIYGILNGVGRGKAEWVYYKMAT